MVRSHIYTITNIKIWFYKTNTWSPAKIDLRDTIHTFKINKTEIGYLLLPCRDMAEIPLKRRKSSIKPTNQPTNFIDVMTWHYTGLSAILPHLFSAILAKLSSVILAQRSSAILAQMSSAILAYLSSAILVYLSSAILVQLFSAVPCTMSTETCSRILTLISLSENCESFLVWKILCYVPLVLFRLWRLTEKLSDVWISSKTFWKMWNCVFLGRELLLHHIAELQKLEVLIIA